MLNLPLTDATKRFGPPEGWDEEKHGPCLTLEVCDMQIEGRPFMVTMWEFTDEEKQAILNGGRFFIGISGHTDNGFPLLNLGIFLNVL